MEYSQSHINLQYLTLNLVGNLKSSTHANIQKKGPSKRGFQMKSRSVICHGVQFNKDVGIKNLNLFNSVQPLPCSGCRPRCAPLRWPPGPSRPSAGASAQQCICLGDLSRSPLWGAGQFELDGNIKMSQCSPTNYITEEK